MANMNTTAVVKSVNIDGSFLKVDASYPVELPVARSSEPAVAADPKLAVATDAPPKPAVATGTVVFVVANTTENCKRFHVGAEFKITIE